MGFQYNPIGQKTPRDALLQAAELPLENVLILGMTKDGQFILQEVGQNSHTITILAGILNARVTTVNQIILAQCKELTGPEEL